MPQITRFSAPSLVFGLLFVLLPFASAQNDSQRSELRRLFVEGRQAALHKRYSEAQARFLEAIQILQGLRAKAPSKAAARPLIQSETRFFFLLAQTYLDQDRPKAAYLAFLRVLQTDGDPTLRPKALAHIDRLDQQKARQDVPLTITSPLPGLSFQIRHELGTLHSHKTPWSGKLWPGRAILTTTFPSSPRPSKTSLVLQIGIPLRLHLSPPSPPPPRRPLQRPSPPSSPSPPFPRRTLWILVGSGLGLLAVTVGLGLATGLQRSHAEAIRGKVETTQVLDANQTLISLEISTFLLLGTSAAILGTGGLLFLLAPSPPSQARHLSTSGTSPPPAFSRLSLSPFE